MSDLKITSITYTEDGQTYVAWPADSATLERMRDEGHIQKANGECTCGSPDFCDHFAHRRVRCFHVTSVRCEWFTTSDYC